jgi:hypothetical protein
MTQGTIPKRLRKLHRATIDAARDVESANQSLDACQDALPLRTDPSQSCAAEISNLSYAANALERKLGAWDAYL